MDISIPSTFISLITASTVTIIGIIMYPFQPWVDPPLEIVGLLSGAGIFYGVVFYNEIPDIFMIIGTLIVIVSGSYVFYTESRENRN